MKQEGIYYMSMLVDKEGQALAGLTPARVVIHKTNVALSGGTASISGSVQGENILSITGMARITLNGTVYCLPVGFNDDNSKFQVFGMSGSTNLSVQLVLGGVVQIDELMLFIEHT